MINAHMKSTTLILAAAAAVSSSAGEETAASELGRLSVSVHGATATSWRPAALGGGEVFFMPDQRPWGGEVHGGLPLCWPWFGRRPGLPIHGLARYMKWRFAGRTADGGGLRFETESTPETKRLWPHDFRLAASLSLAGPGELRVSLTETNTGDAPFESAFGVHPYFSVADACNVAVDGKALPRPNGETLKFKADGRPHGLHDPVRGRTCEVAFDGGEVWWAWNPGVERTPDCRTLAPDEWRRFYCLEPLRRTPRPLAPGETRTHLVTLRTIVTF